MPKDHLTNFSFFFFFWCVLFLPHGWTNIFNTIIGKLHENVCDFANSHFAGFANFVPEKYP